MTYDVLSCSFVARLCRSRDGFVKVILKTPKNATKIRNEHASRPRKRYIVMVPFQYPEA
jgi:hypothetical protein